MSSPAHRGPFCDVGQKGLDIHPALTSKTQRSDYMEVAQQGVSPLHRRPKTGSLLWQAMQSGNSAARRRNDRRPARVTGKWGSIWGSKYRRTFSTFADCLSGRAALARSEQAACRSFQGSPQCSPKFTDGGLTIPVRLVQCCLIASNGDASAPIPLLGGLLVGYGVRRG